MSERFSDEVLQRACRARFDTESALLGSADAAVAAGLTPEITAAGLAAMRAVLEAHDRRCPQCGAELGRNKAFTWCPNGHRLTGGASDGSPR